MTTARTRAATLALAATSTLTTAKMVMAVLSGSVSILSEAIHSAIDLISSLVTFFVVKVSNRPADADHPYGHGKIESLSALFESFLLLVAAGYIAYEAASALLVKERQIHNLDWGLVVIGVSILINIGVFLHNRRVGRDEESIAIETNAFHFLTDVCSSVAVFVALGVVRFTGLTWLDSAVALAVAAYILWVGVAQIRKCVAELSDTVLPDHEVAQVDGVLKARAGEFLSYHDLRTRKVGAVRHVDLHLTVCSEQKVRDAHAVCDRIEDDLMATFKQVNVNIHVEPCGNHAPQCMHECEFRRKR